MSKNIQRLFILVLVMAALTVAACKSKEAFKPEINIEVMSINRENNTFSVVTLVDVDFDGKLIFTLENKKIKTGIAFCGLRYLSHFSNFLEH